MCLKDEGVWHALQRDSDVLVQLLNLPLQVLWPSFHAGVLPRPAIPHGHQNSLGPRCTCYLETCGSEAPPLEKEGTDEAEKLPALAVQ